MNIYSCVINIEINDKGGYKMEAVARRKFILEGLDCANCATKIEKKVNEINGVSSATVNFSTKTLLIEVNKDKNVDNILKEMETVVKRIEPDVDVIEDTKAQKAGHDKIKNEKAMYKDEILKISIGGILFIASFFFKSDLTIQFILCFISYIIVGGEVLLNAGRNILRGQVFDENFLMTVATIGAFAIKQFPEGAAVMLFYSIGELLQDMAVNSSRKSIADLMDIRPDYANIKLNGEIKRVSPEEVKLDDIIIVKPGEKIPLDGIIIDGKSMVDTSALTGEPVPRQVNIGNEVLGGFINNNGLLTIQVSREFQDTTVSKILDLVQNSSSKKAPTENFITKFARYYTPVVVFAALFLAIIPPIVLAGSFQEWIYRSLVFLVISCPCALVVSIPLGFFGGIGVASKNGILIKGGNYLEALNDVDIVVFDKTGTLTKGVFKVTEIETENEIDKESLLKYAAYAESFSNHPISSSIIEAYGNEIDKDKVESYDEISGLGVRAIVDKKEVLAGNSKLMKKYNIKYNRSFAEGTIVYVALDGVYSGCIVISDEIKEDSKKAIDELKSLGVKRSVMLTGDSRAVGISVASTLGIDEVFPELLPDQKVEKIEDLEKQKSPKGKLLFIGDGINDAPSLARADIGVAMGGLGSDAAIEAADIVLMTDEPSKLADSINIAKRTRKIVWQNIIFALSVKFAVLILGAFGIATMWEAVFADVGVTLIAVLNAMRVNIY